VRGDRTVTAASDATGLLSSEAVSVEEGVSGGEARSPATADVSEAGGRDAAAPAAVRASSIALLHVCGRFLSACSRRCRKRLGLVVVVVGAEPPLCSPSPTSTSCGSCTSAPDSDESDEFDCERLRW
jgi:hypothetical protein